MGRYAKIHLWGLTEYDRIIYLDADTMVLRSLDNLFDQELPVGHVLGQARKSFTGLLAVHDQFADIFNSGVMVLQPSTAAIDAMLAVYMDTPSYNIGDQGFLNVRTRLSVYCIGRSRPVARISPSLPSLPSLPSPSYLQNAHTHRTPAPFSV